MGLPTFWIKGRTSGAGGLATILGIDRSKLLGTCSSDAHDDIIQMCVFQIFGNDLQALS